MGGDTGPQYSTDALGNLIPLSPGSPFITNQGDLYNADGTITPAVSLLLPSLPWWVYAAGAVILYIIVKDVAR